MLVSHLTPGASAAHELGQGRGAYLYVIDGDVTENGDRMQTGAAAQVRDDPRIGIEAAAESELILVDVRLT